MREGHDSAVVWLVGGSRDETVATPQNFLSARVFRDEAGGGDRDVRQRWSFDKK